MEKMTYGGAVKKGIAGKRMFTAEVPELDARTAQVTYWKRA